MRTSVSPDSVRRIARIPSDIHHVHLMGVGGTAMAALAGMLVAGGFRVTGSDGPIYEPTASLLRSLKIEIKSPFAPENLLPVPDAVVVGNVITRDNVEAAALLRSPIPYLSMPEAIAHFFLDDRRVLMVTGTHGKTTSTAMIAHVLESAGRDPSMMVGGLARNFGSNFRLGRGPEFVVEGDEYDTAFFDKGPKFLHYGADGAIITAVEFDHADIYRDLEHVKSSFRALAEQMESSRILAVSADSADALEASAAGKATRLTFGLAEGEYRASDIRCDSHGARFYVSRGNSRASDEIFLPVNGRMNVANALGAYVLLQAFGIESAAIERGLATFAGVARRQEIAGEACGVTVVDDFAHHPTAIRATLAAIADRFAGRRIIAAFEPRSNTSRRGVFQEAFATAFDRAARVYIAPVFFKANDPIPAAERLSVDQLVKAIRLRGPVAVACSSTDELRETIMDEIRTGDVVVCMSNGAFERMPWRIVEALKARA